MRRGGGGATGAASGDGNSNGVPLDGYIADTLLVCNSASLVAGEPVPAKLGRVCISYGSMHSAGLCWHKCGACIAVCRGAGETRGRDGGGATNMCCAAFVMGESGAEMVVVPMALELVASISALRISIPPDLRPADARRSVLLQLQLYIRDKRTGNVVIKPVVVRAAAASG
eukprot:1156063-Pelagomonas_calceolata.AAC.8